MRTPTSWDAVETYATSALPESQAKVEAPEVATSPTRTLPRSSTTVRGPPQLATDRSSATTAARLQFNAMASPLIRLATPDRLAEHSSTSGLAWPAPDHQGEKKRPRLDEKRFGDTIRNSPCKLRPASTNRAHR